jgi:multidrug efflux pump subunit AcrA (membrane-fusion protein)
MLFMNRETRLQGSDELIVVDRSKRRRNIIIAAVIGIAVLLVAFMLLNGGKKDAQTAAAEGGAAGGQIPTVTVVIPGRSDVARVITVSGALAARRDQPIGVAGEGGRVTGVLVDQGSWVRAGQVLARDRPLRAVADAAISSQRRSRSPAPTPPWPRTNMTAVPRWSVAGFVSKADLDRKKGRPRRRHRAHPRCRSQSQRHARQVGRLEYRRAQRAA